VKRREKREIRDVEFRGGRKRKAQREEKGVT